MRIEGCTALALSTPVDACRIRAAIRGEWLPLTVRAGAWAVGCRIGLESAHFAAYGSESLLLLGAPGCVLAGGKWHDDSWKHCKTSAWQLVRLDECYTYWHSLSLGDDEDDEWQS